MTGTVIHATYRPEDLIPAFVAELSARLEESTFDVGADRTINIRNHMMAQSTLGAIERRMESDDYFQSSDWVYDMEWIMDALNAYAPQDHYFGSHPGDGSDFGWWPIEDES